MYGAPHNQLTHPTVEMEEGEEESCPGWGKAAIKMTTSCPLNLDSIDLLWLVPALPLESPWLWCGPKEVGSPKQKNATNHNSGMQIQLQFHGPSTTGSPPKMLEIRQHQ